MLGTRTTLSDRIHRTTGIPLIALEGAPMSSFSVDERLRWAAQRNTKKKEDKAYCLLGIFEVYIPPIYGEGDYAFKRLQNAIRSDSDRMMNIHRQDVLASLRFQELGARQANIRNAHNRTCKWILKHKTYVKWRSSTCGTFWIVGKPGAGKSTLMKYLHSTATEKKSEHKNLPEHEIVFGFFFNARGATLERTTKGMYRALLFELFTAAPELQFILDGKQPSADWSLYFLKSILLEVMQNIGPRPLRLFVDALDECDEQEIQEMVEFIEELEDISVEGEGILSLCLASRHYPSIAIRNGVRLNLDHEAGHLDDLNWYIAQQLHIEGEGARAYEIYEQVRRKANGVFLWVVLVVNILNKEIRHGRMFMEKLQKRLEGIPAGLSALFQDTVQRDNEEMEEFLLCVQWILFTQRPLSPKEFYSAMESGLYGNSSLWQPEPWNAEEVTEDQVRRFVQTSSKGLAEVVQSTGTDDIPTVQFIHETVKEFFLSKGHLTRLLPGPVDQIRSLSHERLKNCCLSYLAPDSSRLARYRGLDKRSISEDYPFMKYAAENVLYHANEAADGVAQDQLFDVYPKEHHMQIAEALFQDADEWKFKDDMHSPEVTLLYLAAKRNHPRLIAAAKQKGYDVWQRLPNELWQYPFIVAFVNGYRDALEALSDDFAMSTLEMVIKDPVYGRDGVVFRNWRDRGPDQGLIIWAAERANWGLAEYLTCVKVDRRILLGTSPNITDAHSAAVVPSNSGRLRLLEHLIDKVPWFNAGLALIAAVLHDQAVVAQCILDHSHDLSRRDIRTLWSTLQTTHDLGIPMHSESSNVETTLRLRAAGGERGGAWQDFVLYALQRAILVNSVTSVRLLLENAVDVNAAGGLECYPLQMACFASMPAIVRLLLDSGANIEAAGPPYGGALQAAAAANRAEVVRLLLEYGAGVNAINEGRKTALRLAADYDHEDIVHLLLERGADINAMSGKPRANALQEACHRGNERIVHLLLRYGADASADGEAYGPALQAASNKRHKAVVRLLLDHGADVNVQSQQNHKYPYALCAAAAAGHSGVVAQLLERGAEIDAGRGFTGNALYYACKRGHYDTVKMLIDCGADIHGQCGKGRNALSAAARSGNKHLVSMLLDRGANINASSELAGSALYSACLVGTYETVELLIDRGADINTNFGLKTILQTACERQWSAGAVVQLLLDRGAEWDHGACLFRASRQGNADVVRLLLNHEAPIHAFWLKKALEAASIGCSVPVDDDGDWMVFGNDWRGWVKQQYREVVRLLLSNGAKYQTNASSGSLPTT